MNFPTRNGKMANMPAQDGSAYENQMVKPAEFARKNVEK